MNLLDPGEGPPSDRVSSGTPRYREEWSRAWTVRVRIQWLPEPRFRINCWKLGLKVWLWLNLIQLSKPILRGFRGCICSVVWPHQEGAAERNNRISQLPRTST